jgi:hypothetical protein
MFKTTEAGLEKEAKQWDMGDSCLEDCGPPSIVRGKHDNSQAIMYQIVEEMIDYGMSYDVTTLSVYRSVAFAFRPEERISGLSWSIHRDAGNPAMLKKIMNAAKGLEKKLTRKLTIELKALIEKEEERKKPPPPVTGEVVLKASIMIDNAIDSIGDIAKVKWRLGDEERTAAGESLMSLANKLIDLYQTICPDRSNLKVIGGQDAER